MFRQRRSSQKPGDALLANFRQQFPEVVAASTEDSTQPAVAQTTVIENPIINAPVPDSGNQVIPGGDAFPDHDPTPRPSNESWRFTPSLMQPNSFTFNNFANAPPGYYTPAPGGTNTLFHPQAGDLKTPGSMAGPGLGTTLSMPAPGNTINTGVMDLGNFQPLPPHQLHHFNPFVQGPPPQPAFAPSSFVHQDTGYETMEQDGSPLNSNPSEENMTSIESAFHGATPIIGLQPGQIPGAQMSHALPPSAEKFRFHSTLNAPTAMIRQTDEIPVTYLNKGQAYSLSIIDTHATMPVAPGTKYRTFVRISFEDEEQRQKPGICWSLWKEGRGANEAHQRGGKLQAVEYVEAGQPAEGDDKRTRVEPEGSSFDGFSVIWAPGSQGAPETSIAVRFNFLSTDFSHSKGVKGIPVRLCAKTNLVSASSSQPPAEANHELCYCKVKLFRDHGAERKLSNDVAHVRKSIDKVKHQIAQAESGLKDLGKRKRGGGKPKVGDPQRPGKIQKHKRTWSVSSASSADGGATRGGGGGRTSVEDDLHIKLQTLQDMFTSTRPVSVLYLQGEDQDDPDMHPVSLPGDPQEVKPGAARDSSNWQSRSGRSSNAGSMVSPSPSSLSLASQASAVGTSGQWQNFDTAASSDVQPSKVPKTDEEGKLSGWIEALGVDQNYRPPPEQKPKPAACFYVLNRNNENPQKQGYYQAVYVAQRSVKDLNRRVAKKCGLDSSKIQKAIRVVQNGLEVEMDDEVVQNLKEGQDMVVEVESIEAPVKREWEMAIDDENATDGTTHAPVEGLVLRFIF